MNNQQEQTQEKKCMIWNRKNQISNNTQSQKIQHTDGVIQNTSILYRKD